MGNYLKDIFNDEQLQGYGTIYFKSKKDVMLFFKDLKEFGEVNNLPSEVSLALGNDNNQVPISKMSLINLNLIREHTFNIPVIKDVVKYCLKVEGGEKNFSLRFYPAPNDVVNFDVKIAKDSDNLSFKYKIMPWNAKDLIMLIDHYIAFISFLNYMNQSILGNKTNEDCKKSPLKNVIFTLFEHLRIYLKTYVVFKHLRIKPDKKFFNSLEDEEFYSILQENINIMYWGVLKGLPIRNEGKLEEFKATVQWKNDKRNEDVLNNEITATAVSFDNLVLGDHTIKLIRKLIFYNLIVKKIKDNEIVYGDIDSKPMFMVSSFVLNSEDIQEHEVKSADLIEYKEQYREAKRISEYNKEEVKDTGDDLEKVLQAYELEYKKPDFSNLIFPL